MSDGFAKSFKARYFSSICFKDISLGTFSLSNRLISLLGSIEAPINDKTFLTLSSGNCKNFSYDISNINFSYFTFFSYNFVPHFQGRNMPANSAVDGLIAKILPTFDEKLLVHIHYC